MLIQHIRNQGLIPFIKQFLKFGLVGVSNTLIALGVYYLLVYLGVHYIIANIAGFVVSVINAYYWNSKYVFKKGTNGRTKSFIKCFTAYGITFLLGTFLLYVFVDIAGISDKIAPILYLCVTIPINFFMNKLWAFKEQYDDIEKEDKKTIE